MGNDIKRIALTIIMPCYNTEKYLNKTMASIFSQSFNDYEIIMVDDGSTDSTPKLLDDLAEKHPDRIRVFHKENGGQSTARNLALSEAKGEYVVFWDSDDYAETD